MNTIVPIEYYTKFYYYVLTFIVVLVFFNSLISDLQKKSSLVFLNSLNIFCLISITFYMGFRPISGQYFGDMSTYAASFWLMQSGVSVEVVKDPLFEYFTKFCTLIMDVNFYFFVCAILYIMPLYIFSKRIFKEYWAYSFFILITSMSFWSYGTNGLRNGIATSFFLLALCQKGAVFKYLILFLVLLFHKSLIIPILGLVLTSFHKENKTFFFFWLLSIPVSLALGSALEAFFLNFGFGEEDSLAGYLGNYDNSSEGYELRIGFRWDFLIYSATAVFAAWFYIYKKNYKDLFYSQIVNIYLTANAFWILVIRANFSNRFAYLSWFMIGVLIIYPLLKVKFYENQNKIIGCIILLYFIFTFILNVTLVQ